MHKIGILVLCNFCLLQVQVTESIVVRNDITDRCLHIGALEPDNKETVYATSCTWRGADNLHETGGNYPDDWLEIIEQGIEKAEALSDRRSFVIRKITNASDASICLTAFKDQVNVSDSCSHPESTFTIDIVNQKNFKGFLTSYLSFKIRNIHGKCLTVQPGQAFLKFKECSSRQGLFQVWSACRHNRKCDVDITWSPRHILFPKNNTDIPTGEEMMTNTKPYPIKSISGIHSKEKRMAVNEVLYTVQNAMRIYESTDQPLAKGIALFYPKESLSEAYSILLSTCNDTSSCFLCTQWNNGDIATSNKIVVWLMKWMSECNTLPNQVITFYSKDVLQVPHHLFPPHEQSTLKDPSEKVREHEDTGEDYEHSKSKDAKTGSVPGNGGSAENASLNKSVENTTFANQQETNSTQDYASIIDIRLFKG